MIDRKEQEESQMRYYVNGKEITKQEALDVDAMNSLYLHLAEQGDFTALEKVQFIIKVPTKTAR